MAQRLHLSFPYLIIVSFFREPEPSGSVMIVYVATYEPRGSTKGNTV
tara:strand:- start:342 stop:482 length:141 start_codon:yes stop_codon:yes gene_type:complete